ncbi:MAG TPA: RNA methyltransferase substrate-binding domain-containing protein, partial [Solirubrobacteraceae bacterium]|nr:RNA methyltransferase substrate-binding domain-containing protein [Solirubrobacteraceae bacterium]
MRSRRGAGTCATEPTASSCCRDDCRVIIYGRNPVLEALRGRRAKAVKDVWATAPAAREQWLKRARPRIVSAEEIERRCGSGAHQ